MCVYVCMLPFHSVRFVFFSGKDTLWLRRDMEERHGITNWSGSGDGESWMDGGRMDGSEVATAAGGDVPF